MAYRTMNPSRGTESRRLGSAISVMARAAFARRHIACAKDQRSSHFGACRVCFQLAGRRGVTVLKTLVFGNHLRAKQEDDAGDFEAQQPDNRGRQRAVDERDQLVVGEIVGIDRLQLAVSLDRSRVLAWGGV